MGDTSRPGDMDVREITNRTEFEDLREAWNHLARLAPTATVFQTWEWSSVWWDHFEAGHLWILVAEEQGEVVGIAPFYVEHLAGALRWVRFIGSGRMSNALDFILRPDLAGDCLALFLDVINRKEARWDFIDLLHVRQEVAGEIASLAGASRVDSTPADVDLYVELPGDTESYLRSLDGKFKRNIRRRKKLIDADFGAAIYEPVPSAEIDDAMAELFRLHELRWHGHELFNMLSSEGDQRFHAAVARCFDERGWLRLYRLKLDGVTRAVLYGFDALGTTSAYATRFDPDHARYGLGILLHEHAILRSIEEGARRFDLMRGPEVWKYRLGAKERRLQQVEVHRSTVRSRLAYRLNRLGHRVWGVAMAERERLMDGEGAKSESYWSKSLPRLLLSGAAHRAFRRGRSDAPTTPSPD